MNNLYNQLIEVYRKKKNLKNVNKVSDIIKLFGPELTLLVLQAISDGDYILSKIDGHLIRKDTMTQEEWAKENGLRIVYQ